MFTPLLRCQVDLSSYGHYKGHTKPQVNVQRLKWVCILLLNVRTETADLHELIFQSYSVYFTNGLIPGTKGDHKPVKRPSFSSGTGSL